MIVDPAFAGGFVAGSLCTFAGLFAIWFAYLVGLDVGERRARSGE